MTKLRDIEDIVKEARNDFDLAKASAGREVSMSYWLKETITQDRQDIHTSLVAAVEGKKVKRGLAMLDENDMYKLGQTDGYNQALDDTLTIINSIFKE